MRKLLWIVVLYGLFDYLIGGYCGGIFPLATGQAATTQILSSGGIGVSCNVVTTSTNNNPGTVGGCASLALVTSGGSLPNTYTWQVVTTGSPATLTVNFMGSLDGTTWTQIDTISVTSGATRNISGANAYRFLGCVPATLTGGSSPTVTCQVSVASPSSGAFTFLTTTGSTRFKGPSPWADVTDPTYGALGNSSGATGNGNDDSGAIAKCLATQANTCYLPVLTSGGTTHYRWATQQNSTTQAGLATANGIRLSCGGSNNNGFFANTGAVEIDVDMGGAAGPALILGIPNNQNFNGISIDRSCHIKDISTSNNSPDFLGGINLSNSYIEAGGDAFRLASIAAPTNPATLGTFTSGGIAQTGTVTFNNGNATINGVGTSFPLTNGAATNAPWAGAIIQCTSGACNGSTATILSVQSATQLTLSAGFGGTTQAGATFAIGIAPGTTLFERLTYIGNNGGSTKPSTETSIAFANCATLCNFTPNPPASVPAGVQAIEIFLSTVTNTEKQAGQPFVCTTGACAFTQNFNMGAAATSATAIYALPPGSQGVDTNDHTSGAVYYFTGTTGQGCGVHGDSCLYTGNSNQNHFTGVDCKNGACIDLDAQVPAPIIFGLHCDFGTNAIPFCIESEGGMILSGTHIEGNNASAVGMNLVGFSNSITAFCDITINCVNATGMKQSQINVQCAAASTFYCFQDDATSGINEITANAPSGATCNRQATDVITGQCFTGGVASMTAAHLLYSTASSTGSGSIGATNMLGAATAAGATTFYRVSFYAFQVGAGTSCASNTTIAANVQFTDPTTGSQTTVPIADFVISGNGTANTPIPPNSSGSGATLVISAPGSYIIRNKASTAIQYSTTVTAGGSCSPAPTYFVIPMLEIL